MKKREIQPLPEGFMKSFDAKTKRITPALKESRDEIGLLEAKIAEHARKVASSRWGGAGDTGKLVMEQRQMERQLAEMKKISTRPADKPEGEEATPEVDEKPAEHGHGKSSKRAADKEDGDKAPKKIEEADKELDDVDPKAVKKDFDDRKDKDLDNDGDTDSSDEYLHKRRKAISKSMKEYFQGKKPDALDEGAQARWAVKIGSKTLYVSARNTAEASKKAEKMAKANGNHGVFKGVERITEGEQLDEVSKKTLDSYRQKAFRDQPTNPKDDPKKHEKRSKGRTMAHSKLTNRAKVNATEDLEEEKKVGDTVTYTKGGKQRTGKIVKIDSKHGQTRYELNNAGFVYASDLDESVLEEAMSKPMARNLEGMLSAVEKIEKQTLPNANFTKSYVKAVGGGQDTIRSLHRQAKSMAGAIEDMKYEVQTSGSMYEQEELEEGFKSGDITFNVYAFTKDKARLLVKKASVDHCMNTAQMIEKKWQKEGYVVKTTSEG